ncbi:MAG: ABC transporter permease [Acidimicrobiales bacterium]
MSFFTAVWDIFSTGSLYGSTTRLAVFLALAAAGEWVAERAGTLNISVEGMCLVAAFAGVAGSDVTHSAVGGVAFGMFAGVVVASIQGNMSHRLTANQFVVGLAINVLALGLTSFLRQQVDLDVRAAGTFPGASHLPGVLREVFDQRWTAYLAIPAIAGCWWLVYRTRWGLEVRAVGENPQSADVSGIHVNRRRREAILVCGAMCGLAGSYIAVDTSGFSPNMTSGRGYIAIAAVIFGGWTLRGALAGCVLFGGAEALTLVVQRLELDVNRQFLQAFPYLVTLVVMAVFAKRTRQPQALAQPFVRGLT